MDIFLAPNVIYPIQEYQQDTSRVLEAIAVKWLCLSSNSPIVTHS